MKAKRLVVDAGAIFKGADLRTLADECYTIPEVMQEIRDQASRQLMANVLEPLEILRVRIPSAASIKAGSSHSICIFV